MDLKSFKKIYFIGIKGSGMTALAQFFHTQGVEVIGSDVEEVFFTDEVLKKNGVNFKEEFSEENISSEEGVDLVIYSSAYNLTNPELKWAMENNIQSLSYAEVLGEISKQKFTIAVCGTHGKTTVTAMLSVVMKESGLDPTAIVGSRVNQLDASALIGKSEYFIIEADEYQNKFQYYYPSIVVLTSVDFDHPDYFENFEDYKEVFKTFISRIPPHGFLVAWGGSADVIEVVKSARCNVIFYDFFAASDSIYQLREDFKKLGKSNVDFYTVPRGLSLQVPGKHNLLNASAVLALSKKLKMKEEDIKNSLINFKGTARRFELLGETDAGAIVIDDYAHHPEEVRVTLKAARERYPEKNIICVFKPHTFSRTEKLLGEFSQCFDNCDNLIILDIFGSARENKGSVSSADLVEKIKKFKRWTVHIPTNNEAYENLKKEAGENDVIIVMGAGDTDELARRLVEKEKEVKTENEI
ncbi:MAG: UDP-N-acetylmuramate--L-alanine ligase [Patescibacteria group bacterium]|jgi:UDP-N-acetylmuramate--alanine ligase|nr:UDP-N-acetylmuramate--L-alanine ligase [Patescibacteria group bacterium]